MNALEKYYEEKLYPLQNGVLNIVKKSRTPFFLTGGTALSRHYFQHRYSDDLDLFLINDPGYPKHVNKILKMIMQFEKTLNARLDQSAVMKGEYYTQIILVNHENPEVELKIDLINDVAAHYGAIEIDPILGKIDSLRNILSNKLTAVFRMEPKDVVDIWVIAKHQKFSWRSILDEAKTKEMGVEPENIYDLLMSFPVKQLEYIKWIKRPKTAEFDHDIKLIADDIFYGRDNSLAPNTAGNNL